MASSGKISSTSHVVAASRQDRTLPTYQHEDPDNPGVYSLRFETVYQEEKIQIDKRRQTLINQSMSGENAKKTAKKRSAASEVSADFKRLHPDNEGPDVPVADISGLALSGGGIRSAAFCLGVTQALWAKKADRIVHMPNSGTPVTLGGNMFQHMDYLSTVSGGGYTGTGISVSMKMTGGKFPYESQLKKTEPPVLRHVRDHSNYLFPRGFGTDLLYNLASYLRGIAANIPVILFLLALLIGITQISKPALNKLDKPSFFGIEFPAEGFFSFLAGTQGFFKISVMFLLVTITCLVAWSIIRTVRNRPDLEWKTTGTRFIAIALCFLGAAFVFELQPKLIAGLYAGDCKNISEMTDLVVRKGDGEKLNCKGMETWQATAEISEPIKQNAQAAEKSARVEGDAPKVPGSSVFSFQSLVSFIKDLTLYIGSFTAFFAAVSGIFGSNEASQAKPGGPLGVLGNYSSKFAQILAGLLLPLLLYLLYLYGSYWSMYVSLPIVGEAVPNPMAPDWYQGFIRWLEVRDGGYLPVGREPGVFFLVLAVLSFGLILYLRVNANSPHNLYRDRLAHAFMTYSNGSDRKEDLKSAANMKISELVESAGPFHLVNAALNIQKSAKVNGRGRNAGLFTFSPSHVGSYETGFVYTQDLESAEWPNFTLSSAMAVSAAAASSAMGSQTMRPLAATFALLNIRLGCWLSNPRWIADKVRKNMQQTIAFRQPAHLLSNNSLLLFFRELAGWMKEDKSLIYLSDGGHIENLGLYSLLTRRCRFIIVVDAEADPELNFSSFVTAQRYARIDLGTRIELPVDQLRKNHMKVRKELDPKPVLSREKGNQDEAHSVLSDNGQQGPHCALGTIFYPDTDDGKRQYGVLLYVKASLSGDENDYVRDYARRYRKFPHETTGDQFFSEEQFEAYRALGFHAIHNALTGKDVVQSGKGMVRLTDPLVKSRQKKSAAEKPEDHDPIRLLHALFPGFSNHKVS